MRKKTKVSKCQGNAFSNDFGDWSIERELDGGFALYEPGGLRAAPVYWDASGRCWVDWQSPEDGEGVSFHSPVYAGDVGRLQDLLAFMTKPDRVEPRDPQSSESSLIGRLTH